MKQKLQGNWPGYCCRKLRLKVPKLFLQTALDWVNWRQVLLDWRSIDAKLLSDAFGALKVTHDEIRIGRMLELLQAVGHQTTDRLLQLARGWQQITVNGKDLAGPAYGQALQAARVAFLDAARSG